MLRLAMKKKKIILKGFQVNVVNKNNEITREE